MNAAIERPLTRKGKTFQRIQEEAMRLFLEKGYDATTVEEIAAAAEVSHMTVFRHFPTKEALVFTDRFDPIIEEAIRNRPATEAPLDSIVYSIIEILSELPEEDIVLARKRSRMIREVPSLREGIMAHTLVSTEVMVRALRARGGFPEGSPLPGMAARIAMAIMTETSLCWGAETESASLSDLILDGFATARAAFGVTPRADFKCVDRTTSG